MEIEVLDVKSDKFCAFAGKDAVEEDFEKIQGCHIGSNLSRVFNGMDHNGDVSSVGV